MREAPVCAYTAIIDYEIKDKHLADAVVLPVDRLWTQPGQSVSL